MTDTKQQTVAEFAVHNGITLDCEYVVSRPDNFMGDMHRHFKCVLRHDGRQLTVYFSQGDAHRVDPTLPEVLDCLASDASSTNNARGFQEWANDLGYDTESRDAERIYKAVVRGADKLLAFLGADLYQELLYDCERL